MQPTPRSAFVAVSVLAVTCLVLAWSQAEMRAAAAEAKAATVSSSAARLWVLRLRPGDDLVDSIMDFARRNQIEAGGIVTCVGSLDRARLRYANQPEYESLGDKGQHFEIVSLVGTFSTIDYHLHMALANEKGVVFGGHASTGNRVYTTAEIILVEGADWSIRREADPATTYPELVPGNRDRLRPSDAK